QEPWKRFFIFSGGPLFNFIFAIFVFMAILVIGEPQVASVIGRVVRYSAAEKAGFRSGDRITAIDGKPITRFDEGLMKINESPNKLLDFEVRHLGSETPAHVPILPSEQEGFSVYGEATHVGEVGGLLASARGLQIGISNPKSAAGLAGLKTGDMITALDGK